MAYAACWFRDDSVNEFRGRRFIDLLQATTEPEAYEYGLKADRCLKSGFISLQRFFHKTGYEVAYLAKS